MIVRFRTENQYTHLNVLYIVFLKGFLIEKNMGKITFWYVHCTKMRYNAHGNTL